MATPRRRRRVADQIHKEISDLLQFQVKDPRIGFVTVTGVDITNDFSMAKIYISLLTDNEEDALVGLNSSISFLRYELGRRVRLRQTPDLTFLVDRSYDYGQKIENLLSQIDIPIEPDDAHSEG